jgi:hypothetical protein
MTTTFETKSSSSQCCDITIIKNWEKEYLAPVIWVIRCGTKSALYMEKLPTRNNAIAFWPHFKKKPTINLKYVSRNNPALSKLAETVWQYCISSWINQFLNEHGVRDGRVRRKSPQKLTQVWLKLNTGTLRAVIFQTVSTLQMLSKQTDNFNDCLLKNPFQGTRILY